MDVTGSVQVDPQDGVAGGSCPFTVEQPTMTQRWAELTFVHWAFEPAVVSRLVPAHLRVEVLDGAAWVGLVPFRMRVATAGGRGLGPVTTFCETNVRTYVVDAAGRRGVWFLSLDAARLGAVVVARTRFRLPYFWSSMALTRVGDEITYRCRRRAPRPVAAESRVRVRVGAPLAAADLGPREHSLTARWRLFSAAGGRCRHAQVWHEPWPLHRADLLDVDDHLLTAAGLPPPIGDPLVHYSPGVDVRIGAQRP
ncbi:YqjF family protein [Frankia alni]|uniref:YqjF family protein n=2 Tax=Frankia TaxID=1854 RepID=UPI0018D2EC17